jgi:hypothetical protein
MQIDFHHGVTYVIARLAGFDHRQADVVSYCSQYVDDAVNSGTICFDNGAMFTRISSAHKTKDFFGDLRDRAASRFVGDVLPLGHGAALSDPDRPYLAWRYRDSDGNIIERNNTAIFIQAAHEMCKAMQCFRAGSPDANVPGLTVAQRDKLGRRLSDIREEDGQGRHNRWLALIAQGEFDFPPIKVAYKDKGQDLIFGGAEYNASGATHIGFADTVDSINAIEQAVFKDRKCTFAELLAALQADLKGHEKLHAYLVNRTPKYGSADPAAQANAQRVIKL